MFVSPMLMKQPVAMPNTVLARERNARQAGRTHLGDPLAARSCCLQRKLAIGAVSDAFEQEADRVAEHVLHSPAHGWEARPAAPRVARQCAACEAEEDKLRRKESAGGATALGDAPPVVHETLNASGQPLDAKTRNFFEQRFGRDFSGVRIHAGGRATESARAVNALAYTVGHDIVFREGQYAPDTPRGRRLLAHELVHVVQQSHMSRRLQRFSYAEIKEKAYGHLISGLRTAKQAALDALRARVGNLPPKFHGAANTIISVIDEILGVIETLILAVIGMVVGFGEGVAGLLTGLFALGSAIIKFTYDLVIGIFTNFDEVKQDLNAVAAALRNLPAALRNMVNDWMERYQKASLERQSLMLAELVGQIEALIASFGVAATRAGSAATLAEAGSEITGATARAAGAVTEEAAAGTQAATPALTVIRGGGGTAARATRAGAGAFDGGAPLKIAPVIEEAPAVPPLRLLPPVPAEPAVATAGNAATKAAASGARAKAVVAGVGATAVPATAKQLAKDPCADCSKANWRRFNVPFMNAKLAQILAVPNHPLRFLIANGAWSNRTSTHEAGVHAGHRIGRLGCEWGFGLLRLAVERGWENIWDSSAERASAISKETVVIEGVEVDFESAVEWQKEGHLQGIDLKALQRSTPSEGWKPAICH